MEVVISLAVFLIIAVFMLVEMDIDKDRYGHTIKKGKNYFDGKRYEDALECYEYAIELDSKRPEAYYYADLCCSMLINHDKKIDKMADKYISQDSCNIFGYVLRMFTDFRLENYNKVIDDTGRILKIEKDNNTALEYKAKSYYAMGKYEESSECYLNLINNNDKFICEDYYYASLSLTFSNKPEEAVTLAQKCIENSPKELNGYEALMMAYYKLNKYDQVIETAEEILIMKPQYDKKLLDDKIFDSIREQEKFKNLCNEISNFRE